MTSPRIARFDALVLLFCAAGGFGWHEFTSLAVVRAQQAAAPVAAATPPAQQAGAPQASDHALKAETREVRVDVVVTDKKGAYITDLTEKDFRVYEDNKEQKITSFAFEADPAILADDVRELLDTLVARGFLSNGGRGNADMLPGRINIVAALFTFLRAAARPLRFYSSRLL